MGELWWEKTLEASETTGLQSEQLWQIWRRSWSKLIRSDTNCSVTRSYIHPDIHLHSDPLQTLHKNLVVPVKIHQEIIMSILLLYALPKDDYIFWRLTVKLSASAHCYIYSWMKIPFWGYILQIVEPLKKWIIWLASWKLHTPSLYLLLINYTSRQKYWVQIKSIQKSYIRPCLRLNFCGTIEIRESKWSFSFIWIFFYVFSAPSVSHWISLSY